MVWNLLPFFILFDEHFPSYFSFSMDETHLQQDLDVVFDQAVAPGAAAEALPAAVTEVSIADEAAAQGIVDFNSLPAHTQQNILQEVQNASKRARVTGVLSQE